MRHTTSDDGKQASGGDAQGARGNDSGKTTDPGTACREACQSCSGSSDGVTCGDFCEDVFEQAALAGCQAPLDDLIACRRKVGGCNVSSCGNENNALSVCVIAYCDERPRTTLCTAPI